MSTQPGTLSSALRLMRVYHDMTQTELALLTGKSTSFISQIESGQKGVSLETIEAYAKAFSVPVSSIMFFSEELSSGPTKPIHDRIARKIVALLEWIAERAETEIGG